MAEEEIKYIIPYFSSGGGFNSGPVAGDGVIADLTVTYDSSKQNSDGSHTVTNATGTRQLTDGTGKVVATDQITGLAPQDPTFPSEITFSGGTLNPVFISYDVSTPADGNNPATGEVDFSGRNNGGGLAYEELGDNFDPATSFSAAPVCFVSGTLISTTRGGVAVEKLAVGDVAVTASGQLRPIRWISHRDVDCRGHRARAQVLPIRIAAHAFDESRPSRDLFVSPGHAICVDLMGETLIPAGALVNGSTIRQIEVDEVTYWHVELDSHDVILAENLPAESYLEMGNRTFFAGEVVSLHAGPDARVVTHADFCRPFVADGPLLEAVEARLEKRAVRHAATPRNRSAAAA